MSSYLKNSKDVDLSISSVVEFCEINNLDFTKIRKKVFDEIGCFDESLQARQDWDMWIRLAEKYEIRAVRENLMDLRHHKGPRTASNPHKEINAYIKIRKKYQHLLVKQPKNIAKKVRKYR